MPETAPSPILLSEVLESGEGVVLPVARVDLWKRRWRGVAEDGTPVAVALAEPVADGALLGGGGRVFRVAQIPEELVCIPMPDDASMSAKIGWYLGNRHIPIEVRESELLMENFPTLTDSLQRIGILFEVRTDVLRCKPHSSSHRH